MIQLNHLSYSYRHGINALDDITAEIPAGIHLLMGENGAGKTTLLHIIAGLLTAKPADACTIDGVPTALRLPSALSRTFMVTDDMTIPYTTINEMVRRHACFYPDFDEEMLRRNLNEFGMTGSEPVRNFSLGNRKKAYLAYALALRTDVLLLDEPANGLDINAKNTLLQMLAKCVTEQQTVIISTHTVWDFENLFDGVIVLCGGHLLTAKHVWEVTDRLAFVTEDHPVTQALYIARQFGRFHAIVPNDGSLQTNIDYLLLYQGLHSTQQTAILNILNTPEQ